MIMLNCHSKDYKTATFIDLIELLINKGNFREPFVCSDDAGRIIAIAFLYIALLLKLKERNF